MTFTLTTSAQTSRGAYDLFVAGGAVSGAFDVVADRVDPAGDDASPGTPDLPRRTLRAALASAVDGGVVEVAAGTYDVASGEVWTTDQTPSTTAVPLTVRGLTGDPDDVVLAGATGETAIVTSGALTLEALTLRAFERGAEVLDITQTLTANDVVTDGCSTGLRGPFVAGHGLRVGGSVVGIQSSRGVIVSDVDVSDNFNGIAADGDITVVDGRFADNSGDAIATNGHAVNVLRGDFVDNNVGVRVSDGDVTVVDSTVAGSVLGVFLFGAGAVAVRGGTFVDNEQHISVNAPQADATLAVESTTFAGGTTGISANLATLTLRGVAVSGTGTGVVVTAGTDVDLAGVDDDGVATRFDVGFVALDDQRADGVAGAEADSVIALTDAIIDGATGTGEVVCKAADAVDDVDRRVAFLIRGKNRCVRR